MTKIKIQEFKLRERIEEESGQVLFKSLTPIQITDKDRNLLTASQINFRGIKIDQIEEINGLTAEVGGIISFSEGLPKSYQIMYVRDDVLWIRGGNEILRYKFIEDGEGNKKLINQQELLNWIKDSHLTHVSWNYITKFFNEELKEINETEISNPDAVAEELANHIIANKNDFNLNRWIEAKLTFGTQWWNGYREVKPRNGNGSFHPAVFRTKERYEKVFKEIVGNLTISRYNEIDENDETKEVIRSNMRAIIRDAGGWEQDHEIPSIYDYQIKTSVWQDSGCEFNPKKFLAQGGEPENSGHSTQFEDLKQLFRNNSEFKKFLEVNNNLTLESLPIKEWINADGTIDFVKIRHFFLESGLNIPEEEPTSSNEGGAENNSGSEPQNDSNGEPDSTTTSSPNNTNSSLQTAKNNAIRDITNALVNQEPKLTTKHDLSEDSRDWKKKINAADNENEIINIKDKVLVDIVAKRKAKKEAENVVNNLETEGKDADQLKKQLEEVEKSRGQQIYEDNQSGIDNLKNELAEKVSDEEYCQIITGNVEKNMVKYDIKEGELDPEIKKEWEKLKSGGVKDKDQINEIEKKIAKNVGQKGSKKKLSKIMQEAQEALKLGNKNQIKALKNKLYVFLVSNDIYEKSLLSQKKNDLQNLLKKLENYSGQKQTLPDKFPWKVVIPVALILITFTLGVIIYRKRKKKLKA